jgi:hypothetical protein
MSFFFNILEGIDYIKIKIILAFLDTSIHHATKQGIRYKEMDYNQHNPCNKQVQPK